MDAASELRYVVRTHSLPRLKLLGFVSNISFSIQRRTNEENMGADLLR
jgi:hypothetical protein